MVETNNLNANKFETLQKARRDLMGEIEAVIQYDEHAQNATDNISRQTWIHIKEDELTHIGELLGLINEIDPTQIKFVEKGLKEFEERRGNTLNQNIDYTHKNNQKESSSINNSQTKPFNCGLNLFNRLK